MKINAKSFDVLRPAAAKPVGGVQGPATDASSPQPSGSAGTSSGRSDSVQISDAGRALATGGPTGTGSLSAERVAELRKRVLEGAYNSANVVDQVAKRILERGDA
jgi:anti-sigma28 factor (negative regulator of flagellin synthesis)